LTSGADQYLPLQIIFELHIMPKRKTSKSRGIAVMLIFSIFIALLLPGKRGILNLIKIKHQQHTLRVEIEKLREQIEKLEKEKEALQNPETVEKIAREEFGMAKNDEKVYIVVPKEKKDAQ
jgi:cell division protein FtsL